MTGVAWILLLIGVVFMIGSFFVTEKLSAVRIEPDCRVERRGIKENH